MRKVIEINPYLLKTMAGGAGEFVCVIEFFFMLCSNLTSS